MDVFRRREIKFLLDPEQCRAVEEAMAQHMVPDAYGPSTVCSLYYDTPDYRLIRRSLDKPVYKEKLRLRCYGIATEDADVFLELKKLGLDVEPVYTMEQAVAELKRLKEGTVNA